jgi:hypothetical protein
LQGKPALTRGYYLPPLRGSGTDTFADDEANRWVDHIEMTRDANGE